MNVDGRPYRTIWPNADGWGVDIIDQRWLPHEFRVATLRSVGDAATAIRDMWVRGAPLIGATAAYGLALAMRADPSDAALDATRLRLAATVLLRRPTAFGLRFAADTVNLDAYWPPQATAHTGLAFLAGIDANIDGRINELTWRKPSDAFKDFSDEAASPARAEDTASTSSSSREPAASLTPVSSGS